MPQPRGGFWTPLRLATRSVDFPRAKSRRYFYADSIFSSGVFGLGRPEEKVVGYGEN